MPELSDVVKLASSASSVGFLLRLAQEKAAPRGTLIGVLIAVIKRRRVKRFPFKIRRRRWQFTFSNSRDHSADGEKCGREKGSQALPVFP